MKESTEASRVRLRDIFPPGFDSHSNGSSSASRHPHYSFRSTQLYDSFTECCRDRSLVNSAVVTTAWYGKQTKSKTGHEFILIKVKDTANNLENYIVLDRNASKPSRRLIYSTSGSSDCDPDDYFRIAYEGDLVKLMRECSFNNDYQLLEKIDFSLQTIFYFHELVTLAKTVTTVYPSYRVNGTNCYIYTGTIWNHMRQMYPHAPYKSDESGNRGKFHWFRFSPQDTAMERVYENYQKDSGLERFAERGHWILISHKEASRGGLPEVVTSLTTEGDLMPLPGTDVAPS